MCEHGYLTELCSLRISECPQGSRSGMSAMREAPWDIVLGALEDAAQSTRSIAPLVAPEGGGGGGISERGSGVEKRETNFYDCLYAIYISREMFEAAAAIQDAFRRRCIVCFRLTPADLFS